MLHASSTKIQLQFKRPAGTSRGVLKTKNSWIIRIWDDENPEKVGIGEASIIENLSPEWDESYPSRLAEILADINHVQLDSLHEDPSIRFGIESALRDLENGGQQIYYQSDFVSDNEGIRINGLIWMGDKDFMFEQIKQKLETGFSCIKLKIGAIDFEEELSLLQFIRSKFSADILELRVDANGALSPTHALQKLERLAAFDIHSIEQPIKAGQWKEMNALCRQTPLPIALDEELITSSRFPNQSYEDKVELISAIQPQFIILKPSLVGGFKSSDEWIQAAENQQVGWWITSALEANVGLNAIAQYTATKKSPMPQGLGTGQLFENNTPSTLNIKGELLYHH